MKHKALRIPTPFTIPLQPHHNIRALVSCILKKKKKNVNECHISGFFGVSSKKKKVHLIWEKKKTKNFISYKSDVKTFLK